MKKILITILFAIPILQTNAQWKNVSAAFDVSHPSLNVFEWEGSYHDSAFRAFYVQVNTKDTSLHLDTDTTLYRRLTPMQFYNRLQSPLVVVNASFFEFRNNTNLNIIVRDGKTVAYNVHSLAGKGKDTLTYAHVLASALGMVRPNQLDIAYTYTDSALDKVYYQSNPMGTFRDSSSILPLNHSSLNNLKPWDVQWAIGGGPVLIRDGQINISNDAEKKFAGKAIADHHPRTAMGYTKDGYIILLAVQGRMKNIAVGTTLTETAKIFLDLGAVEAINLDGGGSSCLLINGKETIKPSDPTGQRPVPAVFFVK
jgi:hypothetical protein